MVVGLSEGVSIDSGVQAFVLLLEACGMWQACHLARAHAHTGVRVYA